MSYNDHQSGRRPQYEEYDAGGDDISSHGTGPGSRRTPASTRTTAPAASHKPAAAVPTPPPPAPVEDLLGDFGDDFSAPVAAPPPATNKALPAVKAVSLDG